MFFNKLSFYNILTTILFLFCSIKPLQASIVTTIKPLGLIATEIANEVMFVDVLFPNNQIKHNNCLKPSDIKKIKQADLLIWLGPEIEYSLFKIISKLDKQNNIPLNALKEVNYSILREDNKKLFKNFLITINKTKKINNNYLWLSPKIALNLAKLIRHKLIQLVPSKKARINQNFKSFKKTLIKIKTIINLKLLPFHEKKYFLLHNSHKYFEKCFGLIPTKILSLHSNIQLSINNIYKIRKQLIRQKKGCVFIESSCDDKIINFLIQDTNITKKTIDLLGTQTTLKKNGYIDFLLKLSDQYFHCLKKN